MKWTPDGQRICIIYEDGAVIVGSVDGLEDEQVKRLTAELRDQAISLAQSEAQLWPRFSGALDRCESDSPRFQFV